MIRRRRRAFLYLPLKAAEARLPLEELGGTLMLSRTRGKGLSTAKIADGLLLRLRQGGERLSIIGRPRRAVADLLREAELCHGDECYYRCYLSAGVWRRCRALQRRPILSPLRMKTA